MFCVQSCRGCSVTVLTRVVPSCALAPWGHPSPPQAFPGSLLCLSATPDASSQLSSYRRPPPPSSSPAHVTLAPDSLCSAGVRGRVCGGRDGHLWTPAPAELLLWNQVSNEPGRESAAL